MDRLSCIGLLLVFYTFLGCMECHILLPNPILGYGKSSYFIDDMAENRIFKISAEEVRRSLAFAADVVNKMRRFETNLNYANVKTKEGTPSHLRMIELQPEMEALNDSVKAYEAAQATINLMYSHCSKQKLSQTACARPFTRAKLESTNMCDKKKTSCDSRQLLSPYRTLDGSCNHELDGSMGQSFTPYKRLLFSDYLDGVKEIRRSVYKKKLPSPRLISTKLASHDDLLEKDVTLALMQWGQFIGHDLSHTAVSKMLFSGNSIECCSPHGWHLAPRHIHPFCAPIDIPDDDKFYSKRNIQCISYVRSLPALRPECGLGPIQQLNQATHFLDGSQIYGTNVRKSESLRSGIGGKLKDMEHKGNMYLPNGTNYCAGCFKSGDSRVNSHPQLTIMYTIWLREHNRIARELMKLNPHWNDEKLFQETRRIVIAQLQHITYTEWLSNILDHKYLAKINEFTSYNNAIDASISNSFATAAMRFVTSLMSSNIHLISEERSVEGAFKLGTLFSNPRVILENKVFDSLVRGMTTQNSQKADFTYVEDVSNLMYGNGKYGLDIVSLDIQRGRDHGIPSYTKFRMLCGLSPVKRFEDLLDVMPSKDVKQLGQVYKHPNDIDLLVGGMLETSKDGSLLGPTFSCIIGDQFLRTRSGDKYFYTFHSQPKPFTERQLTEIRKASLSRVLCDNSNVKNMQPNVFRKLSDQNKLESCEKIASIDLKAWKE